MNSYFVSIYAKKGDALKMESFCCYYYPVVLGNPEEEKTRENGWLTLYNNTNDRIYIRRPYDLPPGHMARIYLPGRNNFKVEYKDKFGRTIFYSCNSELFDLLLQEDPYLEFTTLKNICPRMSMS